MSTNKPDSSYSIKYILWVIFYCYSTFAALIFQKLLLPLFPGFHGGSGLIGGGDSAFFNKVAVMLAESIRTYGWSKWTIWPAGGATGNASLLAVLYVIFGNDPTVIIPVNAAVHATSGLFIFLMARLLWPGRVGTYSGIITATLFVVFPSALNWYAQIHKDGFAILGMLIIFYSWLKGIEDSSKVKSGLWIFFMTLVGVSLVVFVRPHNVRLLVIGGSFTFIFICIYLICNKDFRKYFYLPVFFLVLVVTFAAIDAYIPKSVLMDDSDAARLVDTNWKWQKSKVLPDRIDRLLANSAEIRLHNILYGQQMSARSLIDEKIRPDDAWSLIGYMPRATGIALLAPFPKMWFENTNIIRLVSVGETVIWYCLIPGVFLAFWYRRSMPLFLISVNAVFFLAIYGFTLPNIGTLYRVRYIYLFMLMLIGVLGYMELVRKKFGERVKCIKFKFDGKDVEADAVETGHETVLPQSRSTIATAGFAVITFTLVSNILFVARDIILARWFGLGNELDAFFIAMIVPMFLVTVMSIPIGTITVPPLLGLFKSGSREKAQQLITACSTMIFCSMVIICLLLLIFSSSYIPVLGWGFTGEKIVQAQNMLVIVLPMLFFSGFVILGNSILNAKQKFTLPALAQAIVPIVAILSLITMARQIGIYAMAIGMCVGQVANLLIVGHYVHKEGFTIIPEIFPSKIRKMINRSSEQLKGLFSQYAPLVFSSLFVSLALPVNSVIAASLSSGSVSAFNLGTKFILFFTGLIGTGISTVMLPYFSSYFTRNRIIDVRRELSFFLFLATAIPIPLTIIMYLFTGFVVRIIFGGGVFTTDDMGAVTRVVEYGIIQLPFYCTNMLFAKFANAKRKNTVIMISSLLGLALNVILNFVFIDRMGVGGIALASSLSVMFSTALFIVVGHGYNDISWVNVIFIALTWLLFLTILLCYHFRSISGVIIASTSLMLTIIYHLMEFFERKPSNERSAP